MKKVQKTLLVLSFMLLSVLALTACGNADKIKSAIVKSGTLETTIIKGETLDTSNVVAVITYQNGEVKEVPASELTFGTVDTSNVGNVTLKITYNDYSFDVIISVVATEADVNSIISLESQLLTDYNSNRATQPNEQEQFMDGNQPLYVGDDNAFNFRINASGIDPKGELVSNLEKVRTIVTVELKNFDGTYTTLSGDDLTNMVTIDTENTTLDFTEQAIGKEFRVTVKAANADEGYEENATKFATNLVVVDAYNVYTAKELSVYDNFKDGWADIKAELGLTDVEVNGIVLQNDILVTKDDVRQDLFWTKDTPNYATVQAKTDLTLEGTPIDDSGTGIYHRTIKNGEEFNFYGNYFSVNLSSFPKMIAENEDGTTVVQVGDNAEYMTAHLTVFYTTNNSSSKIASPTQVNWKNLYFIGNGELNADPLNSGAILLMKNTEVNFAAYNTVMHNFYIGYFMQLGDATNEYDGEYVIDSCKGYNSYQCLFYSWGAEHLVIKNSEFKNAGGPAIISDHSKMKSNNPETGNPSRIDIINSTIESKVTGKEPWFTVYGATEIVGQLTQAEMLYDGTAGLPDTGKTIFAGYADENGKPVGQLNLICAMKNGDTQGLTSTRIKGYVRVFNTEDEYNRYYEGDTTLTYGLDMDKEDSLITKAMSSGVNYLESNGNGGYINSGFGTTNQDSSILQGKSYADGDYINIYTFLGMGAMIGLYDSQE